MSFSTRLTKFSVIGVAGFAILYVGCYALPKPKESVDASARLSPVILSPEDASSLNLDAPSISADDATKVFKALCHGGKPEKKVEHKFVYVLPHPPPNVALNNAEGFLAAHRNIMRQYAANIYGLLMFNLNKDRLTGHNASSSNASEAARGNPFLMVADPGQSPSALISTLESASVAPLQENYMDDPEIHSSRWASILLHVPGGNPEWIMSVVDPHTYYREGTQVLPGFNHNHVPPDGLTEVVPLELFAIGEFYTLVDTTVPRSTLISEKHRIFLNYLAANTSVTEAPTDDGAVFSFKVSLNTEPLCRTARLLTDLEAK